MYHYRKTRKTYTKLNKTDKERALSCPFPLCDDASKQVILDQNDTMYVIANRVKYDVFEGRRVLDHLMIIPKRHVETLSEFTTEELRQFGELAGKYEVLGYNVFARAVSSVSRSVKHQHTHLIKCDDQQHKLLIQSQRPYLMIYVR